MQCNEKACFFIKLRGITNAMGLHGEKITYQQFCKKVIRSLTPRFDYVVCSSESTKDMVVFTIEQLQGILEAKKMRLSDRDGDKDKKLALAAEFQGKKLNKDKKSRKGSQTQNKGNDEDDDGPESSTKKGGGPTNKSRKYVQDKRKIQCFKCDKFCHYANDCQSRNGKKDKEVEDETNVAKEENSDYEPVIFMTNQP